MLIHTVHAGAHTWTVLFPYKRSLQSIEPSSFTLLGWFSLTAIDQYSSLLPPVGVWTVSQFQCGGPSSQNPYPSSPWWAVTPPTSSWNASPSVTDESLVQMTCAIWTPSGINLPFGRLSLSNGKVGYALRTRAPVAIKLSKLSSCCPSTCMC